MHSVSLTTVGRAARNFSPAGSHRGRVMPHRVGLKSMIRAALLMIAETILQL